MDLSAVLAKYTKIFYFLGESNVIFESISTSKRRLFNLIFFVLNATLIAGNIFFEIEWVLMNATVDISIHTIFFSSVLLTRAAVFEQICSSNKAFVRFFIQFKQIERMLGSKVKLDFSVFNKRLNYEVYPIIFLWILTMIVSVVTPNETSFSLGNKLLFLSMILLSRISICHVLLYLNLIKACYGFYRQLLKLMRIKNEKWKISPSKIELFSLKLIHFKLWELTKSFNQLFGWILWFILLQLFINIVFRSYWILRDSSRGIDLAVALRNYVFYYLSINLVQIDRSRAWLTILISCDVIEYKKIGTIISSILSEYSVLIFSRHYLRNASVLAIDSRRRNVYHGK